MIRWAADLPDSGSIRPNDPRLLLMAAACEGEELPVGRPLGGDRAEAGGRELTQSARVALHSEERGRESSARVLPSGECHSGSTGGPVCPDPIEEAEVD